MDGHPETEKQLNALAEALLRGPSSLSPAEREMIATFVSHGNECRICTACHAATARHLLGDELAPLMDDVLAHGFDAVIDARMRALLQIAAKVRQDGRLVSADDVGAARAAGAERGEPSAHLSLLADARSWRGGSRSSRSAIDKAIHDTVLIAAVFCMFNRYVDGLATWTPTDPAIYHQIGASLATKGYRRG